MLLVSHTVVNLGALNCPSRKVYEVIKRSILEFTIVYWDILSMTRNMYLWLQKQKVHIPGIDPSLAFYEQWLLICTVDPSFIVDPCHDIQVAFILHWYLVPSFKPLLDHVAPADICPQYKKCRFWNLLKLHEMSCIYLWQRAGHLGIPLKNSTYMLVYMV